MEKSQRTENGLEQCSQNVSEAAVVSPGNMSEIQSWGLYPTSKTRNSGDRTQQSAIVNLPDNSHNILKVREPLVYITYNFFFYLFCYLCVCTGVQEDQKKALDPLEPEFRMLASM